MLKNLFNSFKEDFSIILPQIVDTILKDSKDDVVESIAFVTTDDFYGIYIAYLTKSDIEKLGKNKDMVGEWLNSYKNLEYNSVLYKQLVDIVEENSDIDFCSANDKKWEYAEAFVEAIGDCVNLISKNIFTENGYAREEITFFTAVSDGDYMSEIEELSKKLYN